MTFDGIVVAGGTAARLGGVDKPALEINGRSMLDIAVAALEAAAHVIVVGRKVGGGPAAAVSAGLARSEAPIVVVLAADLPYLTPAAVEQLVAARGTAAAAIAVDADLRDQPLLACYDAAALRAALPTDSDGVSMRSVVTALDTNGKVRRVDLGGDPPVCVDCDTEADLVQARDGRTG
jgi:molybdopterin-guanine dinucleotide biosynthesis protein A